MNPAGSTGASPDDDADMEEIAAEDLASYRHDGEMVETASNFLSLATTAVTTGDLDAAEAHLSDAVAVLDKIGELDEGGPLRVGSSLLAAARLLARAHESRLDALIAAPQTAERVS